MKLDELQESLAGFFRERGVDAMAAWPETERTKSDGPVVLVSLEKVNCTPAGLQDYLGQQFDTQTAQWKDLYGRKAQLTFTLDILGQPRAGAHACQNVFDQLLLLLQAEKPTGLSVRELTGDEMEYDKKEGLLRLRCHLECAGWLCTAGDEAGTFLDFTLRGDVNS